MIAFVLEEVELHHPMALSDSKIFVFMKLRLSGAEPFIKHQFNNLFNMTPSPFWKTVLLTTELTKRLTAFLN